jgi:Holliday junction DNA helicase RuvA
MIAYLEGKVLFQGRNFLIIDVNGVGYKVFISSGVFREIKKEEKIKLWTHLYVRETALELYGFLKYPELEFFENVIQISGVGPKTALGILGVASLDNLKKAIAAGEMAYLTKVSGIGRKIAEKIILELKDKMGWHEGMPTGLGQEEVDILEGLKALGYSLNEAREALRAIPQDIKGTQNRLKQALKILGKK